MSKSEFKRFTDKNDVLLRLWKLEKTLRLLPGDYRETKYIMKRCGDLCDAVMLTSHDCLSSPVIRSKAEGLATSLQRLYGQVDARMGLAVPKFSRIPLMASMRRIELILNATALFFANERPEPPDLEVSWRSLAQAMTEGMMSQ